MMYLGDKAVGINNINVLAHGTFISDTDITTTTIDTGVTGWKHFLFTVKSLPISGERALMTRYIHINGETGYYTSIFASSSGATLDGKPQNVAVFDFNSNMINGTSITISGIQSQIGKIYANTEYEWYCW